MREIDVLIFFELENRDLESAILLGQELERRGHTVEFAQIGWGGESSAIKYSPKVIVANSIYDDINVEQFLHFRGGLDDERVILVNYHCEQVVTNGSLKFSSAHGQAKKTLHFAWGEYFKNALVNEGVNKDDITITGCPRLDFYRPEFQQVVNSKEQLAKQFGLDANARWILILGNFSAIFLSDDLVQSYVDRGNTSCLEDKEFTEKSFAPFFEWWNSALSSGVLDGAEIIYRPHPAEQVIPQAKMLEEGYENFHIIGSLPVREWIINSDICFNWTSTSAVEAIVADKPIYSLRPYTIPENLQIPILENIPVIASAEELSGILDKFVMSGIDADDELKQDLAPYFQQDEKRSAQLSADAIEGALIREHGAFSSCFELSWAVKKRIAFWVKLFLQKIGMIRLLPNYDLLPKKRTSTKEIKEMIVRLNTIGV